MLTALLSLVLAAAAPIQKLEAPPKLEAPKLDLSLPEVPKADGLKGTAPKEDEMRTKATSSEPRSAGVSSGPTAKIVSVVNAKGFSVTKSGRKPVGRIEALTFSSLPARVGAFKTCIRLTSADGIPVTLKASFRSPSGAELLSSLTDVTFGSSNDVEVVIDWDGFEASSAGDYKLVVALDGKPASELALPVRGK